MDVGPDERGERPTGAERCASAAAQGELGVALGLLLEGDGQHGAVLAHLDVGSGHNGSRAAHRPGCVYPEHRLAHRAEGVGQVQLGLHHPFEEVGRLPEDHRVDVGHGHPGIVERSEHRLTNQASK